MMRNAKSGTERGAGAISWAILVALCPLIFILVDLYVSGSISSNVSRFTLSPNYKVAWDVITACIQAIFLAALAYSHRSRILAIGMIVGIVLVIIPFVLLAARVMILDLELSDMVLFVAFYSYVLIRSWRVERLADN